MSGWRRCETCRKVRPVDDYDGDATTCRECLTAPAPAPARKRAAPVVRTTRAPRPAAAPAAAPGPRLGTVGSGDLEVRERRARRAAQEALADSHPEEYALLLRDARAAEGLRASAPAPSEPASEPAPEPPSEPTDPA